jgi:opacity protein-like surface antigen
MGYKKRLMKGPYAYSLLLVSSLIMMISLNMKAQTFEIGFSGGGAGYIGDLNPKLLKLSGISAGAYLKANFNPYWSLGIHYQHGRIKANDASSDNAQYRARNLSFYTPLNEVSLQVDFNFLEYFAGGGPKYFSPYIFAGVGGVLFNPKTKFQDEEYKLSFYRTEGQTTAYRHYAITIPFGAGIHFRLKENWGLFTQVGYRTAYTDYLDDVSGRYPKTTVWGPADVNLPVRMALSDRSGETTGVYLGTPGTQRGDFRKKDTYMFVGVGISYTFFSGKCYNF